MAQRILPTFEGVYHYGYSVDLDQNGSTFVLEFHFLEGDSFGNDGAWYIDLYDSGRAPLVLKRKLKIGSDIWGQYRARKGMPKGKLDVVLADISVSTAEAGPYDLGTRVLPRYDDGLA